MPAMWRMSSQTFTPSAAIIGSRKASNASEGEDAADLWLGGGASIAAGSRSHERQVGDGRRVGNVGVRNPIDRGHLVRDRAGRADERSETADLLAIGAEQHKRKRDDLNLFHAREFRTAS